MHDQAQASHPWTPLDDEVLGFKLLHASFQTMMRGNVLSLETRTSRHDFLGHPTAVARTHTELILRCTHAVCKHLCM